MSDSKQEDHPSGYLVPARTVRLSGPSGPVEDVDPSDEEVSESRARAIREGRYHVFRIEDPANITSEDAARLWEAITGRKWEGDTAGPLAASDTPSAGDRPRSDSAEGC